MDIKTFVTEAIVQIIEGAKAAAERLPDAAVCFDARTVRFGNNTRVDDVTVSGGSGIFEYVSFDLAVTTSQSVTSGGGGELQIAGLVSFGGKKDTGSEQSSVSRVQFRIPVGLPIRPAGSDKTL